MINKIQKALQIAFRRIIATLASNKGEAYLPWAKKSEATYTSDKEKITVSRKYEIGGMLYVVNSIFNKTAKRTLDDNIKHLIEKEVEKSEKVS